MFNCPWGREECIPYKWRCDGIIDDCDDASDENCGNYQAFCI